MRLGIWYKVDVIPAEKGDLLVVFHSESSFHLLSNVIESHAANEALLFFYEFKTSKQRVVRDGLMKLAVMIKAHVF